MTGPFDYAQAQHEHPTRNWTGWCLVFVRSAFGVAARYPSAASAWQHADHKHLETDPNKIPREVPVFWTGGTHGYGHIALSRGDGSCWTTDLIHPGKVDVARIDDVRKRWGLHLVGWAEDLNGVRVYEPPSAKPAPKKAEPKRQRPTRGHNIDDAIAAGEKAHTYATKHHQPTRARRLKNALAWLRKINPK